MAIARELYGDSGDTAALFEGIGAPAAMRMQMQSGNVDVWPDNWPAAQVMAAMQTQWRVGFSGPIGLDYNALPIVEDRIGIAEDMRGEVFSDVQAMEAEAMRLMAQQKN